MPLELYEQIEKQAERTSRSVPSYIRQELKRYLWHVKHEPEQLVEEWKVS